MAPDFSGQVLESVRHDLNQRRIEIEVKPSGVRPVRMESCDLQFCFFLSSRY